MRFRLTHTDFMKQDETQVIELRTLEDLMALALREGELIIKPLPYSLMHEIEIYDAHRE